MPTGKKGKHRGKQTNKKTSPAARKAARRRAAKQAADRRSRTGPERLRLRAATPSFTVADVEKSLAFYRDVLGCHVKDRWMHEGKLAGVEMVAGLVSFFLGQDDWKKGRQRVKGEGFRVFCTTVQDVDELAALVKARGGQLLEEPKTQSWGSRDFAVADPDGFKITISSVTK